MKQEAIDIEQYDAVFQKIVAKLQKRKNYVALMVTGSFAQQEIKPGSDIDIIVVTAKNQQFHLENYEILDGIVVEILEFPLTYTKQQLRADKKRRRRFISGIFAKAQFVAGDKKIANNLQRSATRSYNAPIPTFSDTERGNLLFFLGKSPEIEHRLLEKNKQLAAQMRMQHKQYTCLEIAFAFEDKVVPHYKYWDAEVKTFKDKTYKRLFLKIAKVHSKSEYHDIWTKLVKHTVKKLKGL